MVAISSMKSVPPLATSKRPFLEAMAEVNAPFDVAEERGFKQLAGHGAGVDGNEGLVLRGELAWIALAMSSLPVPLSPWMRTVETAGRDLRYKVEDLEHASRSWPTILAKL